MPRYNRVGFCWEVASRSAITLMLVDVDRMRRRRGQYAANSEDSETGGKNNACGASSVACGAIDRRGNAGEVSRSSKACRQCSRQAGRPRLKSYVRQGRGISGMFVTNDSRHGCNRTWSADEWAVCTGANWNQTEQKSGCLTKDSSGTKCCCRGRKTEQDEPWGG